MLVLLLSLMLVTSMLALGEELSASPGADNPAENPTNSIVLPVEPQVPSTGIDQPKEPINQPQQPGNQLPPNPGQPQFQPQPIGTPGQPQPPQGQPQYQPNPGQPQNGYNKDKPMPPNVGNQPGKYPQPPNGKPFQDKEGNQQEMLPPLDESENSGNEQEQPQEIPEANGAWVPLKKIGNFFYFWKPKDAPKEEQAGEMQKVAPKKIGNTKSKFQPDKFQNGTEQDEREESNQNLGNQEGDSETNFQAAYEKDKANTKVDVKSFKGPGEADAAFEQAFKEGSMEIVRVKNMKLVKRTTEGRDEYSWPAHDKIISLSVSEGASIEQNLLAFEYLGKYPSKLNPKSDTLGLPGEGMKNIPPLEETPQFKEGEISEGEQSNSGIPTSSGAMQAGVPEGTGKENSQQQFTPKAPPGCKFSEDKGVPVGFRLLNEGSPQYCDMDEQLHTQKELDASCQNNFECQSNQCSSGKCLDLNAKMEETQSLLQKILAWLGQKE